MGGSGCRREHGKAVRYVNLIRQNTKWYKWFSDSRGEEGLETIGSEYGPLMFAVKKLHTLSHYEGLEVHENLYQYVFL